MHPPHLDTLLRALSRVLDQETCLPAPAPDEPVTQEQFQQLAQEFQKMAIDFTKLQADQKAVLDALSAQKQLVTDLQAKLAAAPHDDPTIQQTVDQMAATLEAALGTGTTPATGADTTGGATGGTTATPATPSAPSSPSPAPGAPTGTATTPTPGAPT